MRGGSSLPRTLRFRRSGRSTFARPPCPATRPGSFARRSTRAAGRSWRSAETAPGARPPRRSSLRARTARWRCSPVAPATISRRVSASRRAIVATARLVASGAERRIDVGEVDGRVFVNSVGFAFDAAVLGAALGRRWPPGDALYVTCAVEQIFRFPRCRHRHGRCVSPPLLLVIANGARFGGSFVIAPAANLSDGLLDIVAVLDASPLRRVRLFAAALRGTHIGHVGVEHSQASTVRLRFRELPAFRSMAICTPRPAARLPCGVCRCAAGRQRRAGAPDATTGSAR